MEGIFCKSCDCVCVYFVYGASRYAT